MIRLAESLEKITISALSINHEKLICIILAALLVIGFTAVVTAKEETYVFDEIRQYLLQDTYLADDGYIGIPISVCTYCKLKPEQTTAIPTL